MSDRVAGVALYIDIAEQFRARLRTEEFPVGAKVSVMRTMQDDYGVSATTAHRALKHLEALGELRIVQGTETEVMPQPTARTATASEQAESLELLADARHHLARASTLLAELTKRFS